jgi:hypothetical protein
MAPWGRGAVHRGQLLRKTMTRASISILDLDESVKPLLGELCWGIDWCNLTNLSLRFGKPRVEIIREPRTTKSRKVTAREYAARRVISISGRWWLWIYSTRWRIIRAGVCVATGSSSYKKRQIAMEDLKGQRLIDIRIAPATGATRFTFDLGSVLEVNRLNSRYKKELWLLYERDKCMRSLCGDGTFRWGDKGSGPFDLHERVRLEFPEETKGTPSSSSGPGGLGRKFREVPGTGKF